MRGLRRMTSIGSGRTVYSKAESITPSVYDERIRTSWPIDSCLR